MRPLVVVAALLLAGCASPGPADPNIFGTPPPPSPAPPPAANNTTAPVAFAHEHVAFALFLGGERVLFNHSDYDLSSVRQVRAHLHVTEKDGGGIVHVEDRFPGGVPDVTLAEFFALHGVRLANGSLTLDTRDGHNGTTWNDTAAARWRVLVQAAPNATWNASSPALVLRDGQRILVAYGTLSPEEIEREEAAVPTPPTRR